MRSAVSLVLALAVAAPAIAQPKPPTPYDRAIAAGYKALTLCSGIFVADRTQQQVETLELRGIHPEYDAIVPMLTAEVDQPAAAVSVAFDDKLPPRRAIWRNGAGCTIQPIGAKPTLATPGIPPAHPRGGDSRRWPMGDAGIAAKPAARLAATVGAAFDGSAFKGVSTGVIVLRDGAIVAERYRDGFGQFTAQRTWSVAKSLAGTIIGAAAHRGLVDPAQPALLWPFMGDPRAAITLDQLLRMSSGLHSATAGNRTDAVYFGGTAVTEETVAWPLEVPPGTRFRYANNDILLAIRALQEKIGFEGGSNFPNTLLFRRIGMSHTVAETDWMGNFVLSSQVWSTARDLARFGLLYSNDGVWNGERILPEGWVKYVTAPSGPQPTDREFGYGATFWLMNRSPGVPADTYAAFGNRGQYVVIVPSRKVVIVRRGEDPAGQSFDIVKFTADVLEAVSPEAPKTQRD